MRTHIYLDESGDLGWNLSQPYQHGGSSRMLTLAAICVPEHKCKYLQRIVRALYQKRKRPLQHELKSSHLNAADKNLFIRLTTKLLTEHPDIQLMSITVCKAGVHQQSFNQDANILYNYMAKQLLLDAICTREYVDLMPDQRSERVNARWNMAEYLNQMVCETSLERAVPNRSCVITPMDSAKVLELQFIDYFAGMVWSRYEFNSDVIGPLINEHTIIDKALFFE